MRGLAAIVITCALLLAGCDGDDSKGPVNAVLFEIRVEEETFTVRAEDQEVIDALEARMAMESEGVVLGTLGAGDGGFNEPWSWHMVPGTIETPDVAIELCDGTPSMVEQDLDYWLHTVERYCPWGAQVVRRID